MKVRSNLQQHFITTYLLNAIKMIHRKERANAVKNSRKQAQSAKQKLMRRQKKSKKDKVPKRAKKAATAEQVRPIVQVGSVVFIKTSFH